MVLEGTGGFPRDVLRALHPLRLKEDQGRKGLAGEVCLFPALLYVPQVFYGLRQLLQRLLCSAQTLLEGFCQGFCSLPYGEEVGHLPALLLHELSDGYEEVEDLHRVGFVLPRQGFEGFGG